MIVARDDRLKDGGCPFRRDRNAGPGRVMAHGDKRTIEQRHKLDERFAASQFDFEIAHLVDDAIVQVGVAGVAACIDKACAVLPRRRAASAGARA